MFNADYEAQVRLLLQCLPFFQESRQFAVKGGTAINLFVRNLPRLSVDIDLTYLPLNSRDEALQDIHGSLNLVKASIEQGVPGSRVGASVVDGYVTKLSVTSDEATIKIEPNLILRGSIDPPIHLDLSQRAQDHFQTFVMAQTLSVPDLYGGKLCAALDRQHPRDLFDVKLMLDDTGITPEIRRAFVVYLAGHNRPMSELLDPRIQDIEKLYEQQFAGMAATEVSLEALKAVQESLPVMLVESLDEEERRFLISLKEGEPDWKILGIERLEEFPAIQWKLINIRKMSLENHASALDKLRRIVDA